MLDDDSSEIQIDDVSVNEGTLTTQILSFTISLTTPSQNTVEVTAETLSGTATTTDGDFNSNTQTLIFAPGLTTMSFNVNINRDEKVESDEQLSVNLRSPVGATILDSVGRGIIRNDDVSIQISDVSILEGSTGTQTVNVPVTIAQSLSRALRFTVNSTDGSAVSTGANLGDSDFVAVSGHFVIPAGMTSVNVPLTINSDDINETSESLTLILSNPQLGLGNGFFQSVNFPIARSGTLTIDNDDLIEIRIDDITDIEGTFAASTLTFTISISGLSQNSISVDVNTQDDSATLAGSDYSGITNQTVLFNPGTVSQTVNVTVNADPAEEGDERFFVNLSNLMANAGVTIVDSQGIGSIENDDATLTIQDATFAEGSGGVNTVNVAVTLSQVLNEDLRFSVLSTDGSASSSGTNLGDNDFTAISGTFLIPAGMTSVNVPIGISTDTIDEGSETFFLSVSNLELDRGIGGFQSVNFSVLRTATLTLTDDDDVAISINDVQLNEGNAGQTSFSFLVTLSNPSVATVQVQARTSDGTATTANGDYSSNSAVLSFAPGELAKTFTVNVNGDVVDELNETFNVNLTTPVAGLGGNGSTTIIDNLGVGTISNDEVNQDAFDFNNDGLADVVIGVPSAKINGSSVGQAYIVLGSQTLSGTQDLTNLGTQRITINGFQAGIGVGSVVSAIGDFNNDGFSDVAVSARGLGSNNLIQNGVIYVLFGSANPPSVIDLSNIGSLGIKIDGSAFQEGVGSSIKSIGDFNNDGFSDFAFTASNFQIPGTQFTGRVYILFGTASNNDIDLANLGTGGIVIDEVNSPGQLGTSLTGVKDFNGDQIPDVVFSSPTTSVTPTRSEGVCYLVFGTATPPTSIDLSNLGSQGVVINGFVNNSNTGGGIASLDFNNDGLSDLAISTQSISITGRTYILFGRANPANVMDLATVQTNGVTVNQGVPADRSAAASSVEDFNNDGIDDLIISGFGASPNGVIQAGILYVIFGTSTPPLTINLGSLGSQGVEIRGIAQQDGLSAASGMGDFNGDGIRDLVVGFRNADPNGDSDAGRCHIVFGSSTHPSIIELSNLGSQGITLNGGNPNDNAGGTVSGR
ncbi:MAG: Calx-beta domain-containing protein [Planctomycetota bacterium]|nr:Calx-beta domain-containing protein [Planctomycetota bacterium]